MEANVWKKDFPQIQQGMVYLDSAAMSLKPQSVIDAVNYYYRDLSVNIHRGLYPSGVLTTHLYEEAREKVAEYLHATADEIVFTRGTTSSLNLVALSYGATFLKKGDVILTSELEHHSSYLPWREIALKVGATIRFVPLTKEGRITVEAFSSVLDEHVKVVALTHVSNVMGFVTPIQEITKLAHQTGAIVVLDAAQSLPHYH
ncbi:MAG: aminotransferase class V-fold PLP-dependent enzyme, partial [Candidatus Izemoplasmatales bacterium]|nr:aminotransferase class V-fold PLP-dependent enzyme [Candidatus Izemoplasmatales bacterium]